MNKRKLLQHILLLTAAFATVLIIHIPMHPLLPFWLLLYVLLDLLPQIIVIVIQIHEVHEKYLELTAEQRSWDISTAGNGLYYYCITNRARPLTLLRAQRINPCRAGPCCRPASLILT